MLRGSSGISATESFTLFSPNMAVILTVHEHGSTKPSLMEVTKWTERERAPGDLCKHSQKRHLVSRGDQKNRRACAAAYLWEFAPAKNMQATEGTQMSSFTWNESILLESFLIILLPKL